MIGKENPVLENLYSLEGKVALVTGASSGLGEHFAEVLARAGAKVVLGARRKDKLDAIVSRIVERGGQAAACDLDVTQSQSIVEALDSAEQFFGSANILINNAGVAVSSRFINIDEQGWDRTMDTNLKGAWRVAQAFSQRLLNAKSAGCIVNISSILGLRVGFGESAYAISKAGLVQMTKTMAMELACKGIRVNALCPGYFKTELNADYFDSDQGREMIERSTAGRVGDPSELDGPLLMLCSDAGSFVNGVALPVDGGHLVSSL